MADAAPQAWLLVRGLGRVAEHWHDFPRVLREATGAEVQTIDLPGVGDAGAEPVPWTVRGNVASLRARWIAMPERAEAWGVLGISLGGMITAEWCARHPQDFTHHVGIVVSGGNQPPWRRLRPGAMGLLGQIMRTEDPRRREELVLRMTTVEPAKYRHVVEASERINEENPVPGKTWMQQLVAASLWWPPREVRTPTLLIGAEQDGMVHPSCTGGLAKRWRCESRMHPTCGHDVPLEAGEWVAGEVAGWAGGSPGPSPRAAQDRRAQAGGP